MPKIQTAAYAMTTPESVCCARFPDALRNRYFMYFFAMRYTLCPPATAPMKKNGMQSQFIPVLLPSHTPNSVHINIGTSIQMPNWNTIISASMTSFLFPFLLKSVSSFSIVSDLPVFPCSRSGAALLLPREASALKRSHPAYCCTYHLHKRLPLFRFG